MERNRGLSPIVGAGETVVCPLLVFNQFPTVTVAHLVFLVGGIRVALWQLRVPKIVISGCGFAQYIPCLSLGAVV